MTPSTEQMNVRPVAPGDVDPPAPAVTRLWLRVPAEVRAIIIGFGVLVGGNLLPQGLFVANVRSPAVPWSVALIALYLWLYWQYVSGRWSPQSTAESRRRDLRATALTPVVWRWALIAGGLGIAALTTASTALARVIPLGLAFPPVLQSLPPMTRATLVVTISIMAGIVEEAAFRGYMQSRIERARGPVAAIILVSVVFVLAHLPTSVAAFPRMCLIFAASVGYGALAYLTGSILPGLVLHAAGDVFSFALLWRSLQRTAPGAPAHAAGIAGPTVWGNVVATAILVSVMLWCFGRLASLTRATREQSAGC